MTQAPTTLGRRILLAVLACMASASAAWVRPGFADPLPPGDAQATAELHGVPIALYTYRPARCTPRLVLIVFHGVQRDAGPYRDHARPLADRLCAAVVAPEFDRRRFPRDRYQYGGMIRDGLAVAPGARSIDLVPALLAWAQDAARAPAALIAHSAGAQFLDRVAAYAPPPGVPFLIANPSSWVMPDTAAPPFGFGGMPEAALRAYLALPLSIVLGGEDTGTRNLAMGPEAMAQGPNRLARGQAAFAAARDEAQRRGWPFGWHLAVVPGVGHDAARIFASDAAAAVFAR